MLRRRLVLLALPLLHRPWARALPQLLKWCPLSLQPRPLLQLLLPTRLSELTEPGRARPRLAAPQVQAGAPHRLRVRPPLRVVAGYRA